jgi:hypothetical protein
VRLSSTFIVVAGMVLSATGCSASRPATLIPLNPATSAAPTSPSAGAGCRATPRAGSQSVIIDWVDFVHLNQVEYVAGFDGAVPAPVAADIGVVVGTVSCQLSSLTYTQAPAPTADGDAAFLPVGTQVHAIRGFAPECRVVARHNGQYRVYLAHHDVDQHSVAVPCAKAVHG